MKLDLAQSTQAAITYHKWWLINNKHVFLTALEAGKSKTTVAADLASSQGLLSQGQWLLLVSSRGGRSPAGLWVLFYNGPNPTQEGSDLMT